MSVYTKPLWKYWFSDEENLQYTASTTLTVCLWSCQQLPTPALTPLWLYECSISLVLSCFRLLVWTFPWTFELCVSLWAECALQNPGASSSNSVGSGKNWMSNLAGNTEFWQGAPWKPSSSPAPLLCPGPWASQRLLSWCLGLWSCSVPCSCLSGPWTAGGYPASPTALTGALCWIFQQRKCFSLQQETLPADHPVVPDHLLGFYQSFQWMRWKRQQYPLVLVSSYLLW